MRNNIKMFFAAIILSLTPVLVLSEQIETEIFADTITVQKGEVLSKGNVLVRHGNNQIKAASLQFDKKSNEIKFESCKIFMMETPSSSQLKKPQSVMIFRKVLFLQPIFLLMMQLRSEQKKFG